MKLATRSSAKWVAVLAIAAAVRLVPWSHAPPGSPAMNPFDGDCHYHRLRAELIAADFPHAAGRDPDLGGGGIDILWPPLFDELMASAALVLGGGEASRRDVAYVAAWTPVVIGVATVPLVGWLAGILMGPEVAFGAALLAALSTPHATFSLLGRSDHHVLELLLSLGILIAYAGGLGAAGARRRSVAVLGMGVAIALSFWNWPGSALNLVFIAGFVAVWHVLAPCEDVRGSAPAAMLAAGCGAGAVLFAASLALLGPPGALARMTIVGITGLHVVVTAGAAAFGGVLFLAWRKKRDATPWRRISEVIVAGGLPLAAAAAAPDVRGGLWLGLLALLRGNQWYASIGEFSPMFLGGQDSLREEVAQALAWYGLMPLAAVAGVVALHRRWRGGAERRPELLLLVTWGATSFGLALGQYRFGLYAAAPLAIWGWVGIRFARERWVPRLCRAFIFDFAVAIVLLAPVGSLAKAHLLAEPKVTPAPLLAWLGEQTDATAARTVYARWTWGHHVRALARRPAVANPFGTDGGVIAFEESLRTFLSTDDAEFLRVLGTHRAGYLLNENPRGDVLYQGALPSVAPAIADVRYDWRTGLSMTETERYRELVSYRLYAHDGSSTDGSPALGSFRLLRETEPEDRTKSDRPAYSLFGVIPGARLRLSGTSPGAQITAITRVRTNTGREFRWQTTVLADERGNAEFRVPYATGENGSSVAAPLELSAGEGTRIIHVPEAAVLTGENIDIALRLPAPPVADSRARGDGFDAVP